MPSVTLFFLMQLVCNHKYTIFCSGGILYFASRYSHARSCERVGLETFRRQEKRRFRPKAPLFKTDWHCHQSGRQLTDAKFCTHQNIQSLKYTTFCIGIYYIFQHTLFCHGIYSFFAVLFTLFCHGFYLFLPTKYTHIYILDIYAYLHHLLDGSFFIWLHLC